MNRFLISKKATRRIRKFLHKNYRLLAILVSILICILGCTFLFTNCFAKDTNEDTLYKYYTTITIEYQDTLTSIAQENYTLGYDSTKDYINEVCFINHINDEDKIFEGQSLLIPYYSYELK